MNQKEGAGASPRQAILASVKKPDKPPASVWEMVASKNSPDQLLQKIMKLANQGWVTSAEVEATFGIKFKPPVFDKGVGYIYVAEGSTTRDGHDFELFQHENSREWTLILNGFGDYFNRHYGRCIRYDVALKTILDMGWKENNIGFETIEFQYDKKTEEMWSWLHIENRLLVKENSCFNFVQFSNAPIVQTLK